MLEPTITLTNPLHSLVCWLLRIEDIIFVEPLHEGSHWHFTTYFDDQLGVRTIEVGRRWRVELYTGKGTLC